MALRVRSFVHSRVRSLVNHCARKRPAFPADRIMSNWGLRSRCTNEKDDLFDPPQKISTGGAA